MIRMSVWSDSRQAMAPLLRISSVFRHMQVNSQNDDSSWHLDYFAVTIIILFLENNGVLVYLIISIQKSKRVSRCLKARNCVSDAACKFCKQLRRFKNGEGLLSISL